MEFTTEARTNVFNLNVFLSNNLIESFKMTHRFLVDVFIMTLKKYITQIKLTEKNKNNLR